MSAAVTDAVNAARDTVNQDTVWQWPCAALMLTAVLGFHWAWISGFSIFIKFGKYFFKYLSWAPSLQRTSITYTRSPGIVPQLRDALFTGLKLFFIFVFHLYSYCYSVPKISDPFFCNVQFAVNPTQGGFTLHNVVFISRSLTSVLCILSKSLYWT